MCLGCYVDSPFKLIKDKDRERERYNVLVNALVGQFPPYTLYIHEYAEIASLRVRYTKSHKTMIVTPLQIAVIYRTLLISYYLNG